MGAHHARAMAPVQAEPAFDPPIDPWLRMRLAPGRGAHRPASAGTTVRDALRAIASARPDPAMLALELRPVRALLDREREWLRQRLADGAPAAEIAHAAARLLDATIIGLCDLGRMLESPPADMAPPLAVIARGDYGRPKLAPGARADVLFLVAADPVRREHGLAIARFVARELTGLGWNVSDARRTVRGCLAETHLEPAIAADLSAARLVWGCHGLFADLRAGLAQAMRRGQSRTIWDTPERSVRPVLAA
jgi:UTP:GlnB (protein PII) uridylyltransferase